MWVMGSSASRRLGSKYLHPLSHLASPLLHSYWGVKGSVSERAPHSLLKPYWLVSEFWAFLKPVDQLGDRSVTSWNGISNNPTFFLACFLICHRDVAQLFPGRPGLWSEISHEEWGDGGWVRKCRLKVWCVLPCQTVCRACASRLCIFHMTQASCTSSLAFSPFFSLFTISWPGFFVCLFVWGSGCRWELIWATLTGMCGCPSKIGTHFAQRLLCEFGKLWTSSPMGRMPEVWWKDFDLLWP